MRHAAFPLTLAFAVSLAGACLAQDAVQQTPAREDSAGAVMRQTDSAFTCEQLVAEGAKISETLGGTGDDAPMFGKFDGVLRLGAALFVPGAGMVMAGADALAQPEQERKQAEDLARMGRWYYLSGLYIGRGCDQPQVQPVEVLPVERPAAAPPAVTPNPG